MERGRERATEWIDPRPDERTLLLGSGTGLDLKYLSPEAWIAALNAVPAMVNAVPAMVQRTKARARTLNRTTDARALPFDEDAFDVVLLHLFLSVVGDSEAVVAETERVLAPGGRASTCDKFVPEGKEIPLLRCALHPVDVGRFRWRPCQVSTYAGYRPMAKLRS